MTRFTPEQAHAIERRRGELLLDAGAGSGKTTVLVQRFVRSVQDDDVAVGAILTITFTEKAAAELRERIRAGLREAGNATAARETEGAWISTIHAFCARLLRAHALEAGLDPEFAVLDERAAATLRSRAFDAALAATARTAAGTELIAAYGPGRLRSAIVATYDELRARGQLEPQLPEISGAPHPLDVRNACVILQDLAMAVAAELAAEPKPGVTIERMLAMLELVPEVVGSGQPWPADLERLRLASNAKALRSQACDDYRAALEQLQQLAADVLALVTRDALDALLRAYDRHYTELKRAASGVDFSDLELLARELLRNREIGSRYRERFARVMVDEMQDTNHVQLELIDLVAGVDLFMVGDAQQSIYGFRHADVELFEQRGAKLEQIGGRASLQMSFRALPEILVPLNSAFERELGARFRPLVPWPGHDAVTDPRVELIAVDIDGVAASADPDGERGAALWRTVEARALAARVRELIDAGDASAGEVVLLLRATTDMALYEQALERAGVPTYVIGGRGYWAQQQVQELCAYLRILVNPEDTEALYTVFLSPLCGMSLDGLVLAQAGAVDELSEADRVRVERFDSWFRQERRAAAWTGAEQLIDRALALSGYEARIAAAPDGRRRLANVRKLMRLAREWQAAHGSDLRGFVAALRTRAGGDDGTRESEAPVEGEALDAVRLMTIHRSKGLEFPVVCVADLGRGAVRRSGALIEVGRDGSSLGLRLQRPGSSRRIDALAYRELREQAWEFEREEERRLLYVAMTRAQRRLILSGAANFEDWQEKNRNRPLGWVGAAFVPDIATRAVAAASTAALAGTAAPPQTFVTELGVSVSLIGSAPPQAPVAEPELPGPPVHEPEIVVAALPEPDTIPHIATLSYTALATYEQCPYRFYAERVLGLPEAPSPPPPPPEGEPPAARTVAAVARPGGRLSAAERGNRVHALLAQMDFREPSLSGEMPADVRALLVALIGSATFRRLRELRDVRREQPFAFPTGATLITGVFDLLARERHRDRLLVVDYKSDRLAGAWPEEVVAERYSAQRTIYALAALTLGAAAVEVVHLFLEEPDAPVSARFAAADRPTLEAELTRRVAGPLTGDFPVTATPGRRVCDGCPAQGGLCSYPLALTAR